jgi:hypothetical protein
MCPISRDPRRNEYTTCTAVAPDLVFTVLTYGTRPLYEPPSVRNFSVRKQQGLSQVGAQIPATWKSKPKVSAMSHTETHDREPSQVGRLFVLSLVRPWQVFVSSSLARPGATT